MIGASPAGLKVTRPMRVVSDETHAYTIPPSEGRKAIKPDGEAKADGEAKDAAAPASETTNVDSVPTGIAHADTGRIQALKDKEAADKTDAKSDADAPKPETD